MILSKILGGFFGDAVSRMGIRGVLKSMYYSRRHTGQVDMFLFGRNVLTEIDPKATFDITGRLAVSVLHVGACHPDLQKSKFSVTETGTVTVQAPGGNVSIGPGSVVHVEGDLSMGNSYVNSHARIICGDRISIGNGCSIAWNVQLIDDDRHALSIDGEQRPQKQSIEIQDNVWIGHDTTVKKGVTIGEGAVIGSNSVVTTDIPPHTLAVGSPAEVIANHVDWGFED